MAARAVGRGVEWDGVTEDISAGRFGAGHGRAAHGYTREGSTLESRAGPASWVAALHVAVSQVAALQGAAARRWLGAERWRSGRQGEYATYVALTAVVAAPMAVNAGPFLATPL